MLQWLFGKKKQEPQTQTQQPKKKKKSQAEQQTQDKWQYQFLLQFLNSPLWRVSILDFVDQNCVIFDNQQENKFEYTKVHNQFKELVGSLFDGMMQEIGLDDQKLVQLLEKGFQSKQKKLFNQLLLCDDFLKFKELMVKRNKTLENQALKAINGQIRRPSAIEKQRNIIQSSIKQQQQRKKKLEQQEQQILRKVLQMSRIEAEQKLQIEKISKKAENFQQKKVQEQKLRAQAQQKQRMQKMQKLAKQQAAKQEASRLARQNEQKQKLNNSKINKSKNLAPITTHKAPGISDLPPLKGFSQKKQVPIPEKKQQPQQKQQKPQQSTNIQQQKEQSKAQSTQDRKKRLLEQRQKIRKKKQQQRKKMLQDEETNNKKTMNIVLQEQGIHDSVHPHAQNQVQDKVSKDEIERRKQIMKKIKNRIVDDF